MQTARLYPRARGGMSSQGPAAGIAFGGGRCLPPLHTRFSPSRAPVRCLASKSDKSWSEIAAEAAQLGTDLAKKVGSTVTNTVSKAVEALLPSDSPQSQEQKRESERLQRVESERRRQQDIFQPPGVLCCAVLCSTMLVGPGRLPEAAVLIITLTARLCLLSLRPSFLLQKEPLAAV